VLYINIKFLYKHYFILYYIYICNTIYIYVIYIIYVMYTIAIYKSYIIYIYIIYI
jgi:hypothetical protein